MRATTESAILVVPPTPLVGGVRVVTSVLPLRMAGALAVGVLVRSCVIVVSSSPVIAGVSSHVCVSSRASLPSGARPHVPPPRSGGRADGAAPS